MNGDESLANPRRCELTMTPDDEAAERAHMPRIEDQVAAEYDARDCPSAELDGQQPLGSCSFGCDDPNAYYGCDGACREE